MTPLKTIFSGAVLSVGMLCHAAHNPPNFVLFLTDDQRVDTLGCYHAATPLPTPNIDRLAQRGIRFENGFATTPICVVSRASILTGRYESNTRQHQFETLMPDDVFELSYPMLLGRAGYFTGQLGKYGVGIRPEQKKRFDVFDAQEGQGPKFRQYQGRKMHDAEWLTVKAKEFLDRVPAGQPFCLQVNYKEPHGSSCPAPEDDHLLDTYRFPRSPQDTPEAFAKLPKFVQNGFGRVCYEQEFNRGGDHNPFLRNYHEKIASVERSVGRIMEMLEAHGLAENTVVLFLSDHGTHFGERQLSGKWTPYEQSLRIPFILYDPRPTALKKAVRDEMVLNIDIAPTLLDLAGLPIPKEMDGRSLAPLIEDRKTIWRDRFYYEHFCSPAPVKYIPRNEGMRTATEKYVRWIDMDPPIEEFYDLARDPAELDNRINDPEYRERVEEARRSFAQWRKDNPSTYRYDVYGRRAQALAPEIDWERFKEAHPKRYEKIKVQIEKMGVTWEQAVNDWDVRYEICSQTGYWY